MGVLIVLGGFYVIAVIRRGKRALDNGARVPWGAKSVLLPRWAARWLFTPWTWRPAPELRHVERVGLFRSLAGLVVVLGVTGHYGTINWLSVESDHVDDTIDTFAFGLVAVPVTMLVVLLRTRRDARRAVALRMLVPLGTIALVACVFAVMLVVAPRLPPPGHIEHLPPVQVFALTYALGWYLSFVMWMVTYCGRHFFNVADVHPVLAPLCTVEASWLVTLTDLLGRQDDGLPRLVAAGLTIGGSVTITALACWELAILRRILPARLRDGPLPRGVYDPRVRALLWTIRPDDHSSEPPVHTHGFAPANGDTYAPRGAPFAPP